MSTQRSPVAGELGAVVLTVIFGIPRLVRAAAAVDAPVPPSVIARSVIPVIDPLVMFTLVVAVELSSCEDRRFID